MYEDETFNVGAGGYTFRVRVEADDSMGAPWEEHDGHGEVSGWTTRDKRPGEIVLSSDRWSKRYYDVQASMKIARRDGWGLGDDDRAALVKSLAEKRVVRKATYHVENGIRQDKVETVELPGRDPAKPLTRGEITAEAVRRDFEYLRRWCADQWHWVGLVVELLDGEGESVGGVSDSLWGMESGRDDYLQETAQGMADGLAAGLQREARERMYWNARDVETV
ncbi:hypothetical protein [Paraburkholderia dinghuensis]|uniref:DUF4376 domain-containing protein n=1 Tax=Paraburkholderia dinghuensis TaxID=2305225 RepID=A0A3N6MXJ2_9BURK|nr:hypothetical protein [Paraburkholderia dinghuensis]RQH02741.1 hypothetical protein D1Y85_21650 [Paraburkholderia dinghuensis]